MELMAVTATRQMSFSRPVTPTAQTWRGTPSFLVCTTVTRWVQTFPNDDPTVLLRVLEYYNGILIMTTNRLKSMDIAVQSRISRIGTISILF